PARSQPCPTASDPDGFEGLTRGLLPMAGAERPPGSRPSCERSTTWRGKSVGVDSVQYGSFRAAGTRLGIEITRERLTLLPRPSRPRAVLISISQPPRPTCCAGRGGTALSATSC